MLLFVFLFFGIFEGVRLLLLSLLYGTILHFILQWVLQRKWRKRFTYLSVFALLLLWNNSYWGDKGGADYWNVPIGNGIKVGGLGDFEQSSALMEKDKEIIINVGNYIKVDEQLFGQIGHDSFSQNLENKSYFVFHIPTRRLSLLSEAEYEIKMKQDHYPDPNTFLSPRENYDRYWGSDWLSLMY